MDRLAFEQAAKEVYAAAGMEFPGFKNGDESILSIFRQGVRMRVSIRKGQAKQRALAQLARDAGLDKDL